MAGIAERTASILRERCPRCDRGRVFDGMVSMNERCAECDLAFSREPGYFVGAMYFSYGIGVGIIGLFVLLGWLVLPESWSIERLIIIGWLCFLPLVPVTFRASRVLWLHFDHLFDPVE